MTTMTLAQYKARGGYVANVPFALTHIYTRDKTIRETFPPEPHWPEGRTTTRIGPEVIPVEIVEGKRVARFRDLQDFKDLRHGSSGLAWEKENPDLMRQIANEGRNWAGTIR